ncbi:MAG: NADP-dependent oxidoreductase [Nitrospinota bacterium]|nr:MAG: NADP-dependent oxidoreductase [Nitrospinota bacterium]
MPADVNRQIILAARPVGYPKESDFQLVETPIPQPQHGEVLVKTLWLSLDPYQRGRMSAARSYAPSLEIGEVIVGGVVGRVIASQNPRFAIGDIVEGRLGWQEYALSDGHDLRKVDPQLAPISTALGVLGMPGMTAYFGLLEIGRPKPGDTVVVSAAAGAVGQVVGQIARLMNCRVVGTAGTPEKIEYIVNELGFDVGINYKTEDLEQALSNACPDGVDVYFDNVGGPVTDAVLNHLAPYARVVICGQISQYNLEKPDLGPRNLRALLTNQARMEGFLVFQFANRYQEGIQRIARWIREGKIKYKEDVVEGLENAPRAFIGLFEGKNFGKLLVKVADE